MSTTILPCARPVGDAVLAEQHLSTSGVSGTIVMTMSAFCATSLLDLQATAPAARELLRDAATS